MTLRVVMTAVLVASAACAGRQQLRATAPDDHLEPVRRSPNSYDTLAEERLVPREAQVRMFIAPAFGAEEAVWLELDAGRPIVATARVKGPAYQAFWAALKAAGRPLGEEALLERVRTVELDLDSARAPIAPATEQLVRRLWALALGGTRTIERNYGMVDGTTWHLTLELRGQLVTGETWSPPEGSRCAGLAAIGARLVELARAKPRVRRDLEAQLVIEVNALMARFDERLR